MRSQNLRILHDRRWKNYKTISKFLLIRRWLEIHGTNYLNSFTAIYFVQVTDHYYSDYHRQVCKKCITLVRGLFSQRKINIGSSMSMHMFDPRSHRKVNLKLSFSWNYLF